MVSFLDVFLVFYSTFFVLVFIFFHFRLFVYKEDKPRFGMIEIRE